MFSSPPTSGTVAGRSQGGGEDSSVDQEEAPEVIPSPANVSGVPSTRSSAEPCLGEASAHLANFRWLVEHNSLRASLGAMVVTRNAVWNKDVDSVGQEYLGRRYLQDGGRDDHDGGATATSAIQLTKHLKVPPQRS